MICRSVGTSGGRGVLIARLSMGFAEYKNQERANRSAHEGAQTLRAAVGEGATVTSWYTLWSQPELFYYAHVNVHPAQDALFHPPFTGWLVYYDEEWEKIPATWRAQLTEPVKLLVDLRGRKDGHVAYLVKAREP